MKNNKGFTLVEMLVSFTLSMILVIILFQLIINLKDIYISSGMKTELLNKQYLMTNKIYTDLNAKKAIKIENCANPVVCIEFTFQDGSTKRLELDEANKTLAYDNYIIKLNNESYFKAISINTNISESNKKIFNANIPIYNDLFKDTNFGINIVYPYNDIETTNNYGYKYIPPTESYISLPYIKTNGNQYINLNYAAKINTEIRLDIELIENSNTNVASMPSNIIGRDANNDNNTFTVNFGSNANESNILFYWVDTTYSSGAVAKNKTYDNVTSRSMMIVKSGSATFQGITHEIAIKTGTCLDNMVLLGSYTSSMSPAGIYAFNRYDTKIYGFQIYEGDTLVMNLTPAKSRETNKIGLYDTITNNFYTSNGSSDFIYE
jgi:hypothetical protein